MMESEHPRYPSFGLQWEFLPGQDLSFAHRLERMGFSHWSLCLETHLKYGGPLGEFLEERAKHSQLRFFSYYLPVAPATEWDEVHRLMMMALLENSAATRLTCFRRLPQIPPPQSILGELLARVPLSTEVNILVESGEAFEFVRRMAEVSATVRAAEFEIEKSGALPGDADLITEVLIDPLEAKFAAEATAALVCRILELSRGSETLDVNFVLPKETSRMELAARLAAEVRDRVISEGWSRR